MSGSPLAEMCGIAVVPDHNRIKVRVPFLETDMQGGFIEEELLPLVGQYRETTWVFDLSAYEHGLTLSLAGLLDHLRDEGRQRGCVVTFLGINDALVY